MGKVVMFGGTFNPIHSGHVEMIKCLSVCECVEKVVIIPTKIPPHKTVSFLASETDRLELCRIATEGFDKVVVSDIELTREGKSYTIDTLLELKKVYPESELAIAIGADMLVTLDEWKDYQNILKNASIITFFRNDTESEFYDEWIVKLEQLGANIIVMNDVIKTVSSTEIRNRIEAGKSVTGLVPKKVEEYILNNAVYGDML